MAVYALRDIETTDDGDIVIDTDGDLKLATPLRTVAQAINACLLTNKGDLISDPQFGANLEAFAGRPNSPENRSFMEVGIIDTIRSQGLIKSEDLSVDVVALEVNKAGVIVNVDGRFLNFDSYAPLGSYDISPGLTMGYIYPFIGGEIERINA